MASKTSGWILWLQSRSAARRKQAVTALCAQYEPLVKSMALRYRQPFDSGREELEQVARLALVEACATFDLTRWKRRKDGLEGLFAHHAMWSVRHALSVYVGNLPNPVRLPSVLMNRLPKLRRELRRLANELKREPTIAELTRAVGMPNGKYQKNSEAMIAAMLAYNDGPLELSEDDDVNAELTPTPEDRLLAKEEYFMLRRQRGMR
jgi:DNA-directed RNA polymerase specialized sigma subunit